MGTPVLTPGDPLGEDRSAPTAAWQWDSERSSGGPAAPPPPKKRDPALGWRWWGVIAVVVLAGVGGIGSALEEQPGPRSAAGASSPAPAAAQAAAKPEVEVTFSGPETVRRDAVVLRGTVSPDRANVRVHGVTVRARNGRWRVPVTLNHMGTTTYEVRATRRGHTAGTTTATVDRERSAAEEAARQERLAAERAARQAARAARIAQREADFKAGAVSIPYSQLNKNADAHTGERVTYTGQILQIQEDGYGGMMLLSVTDEGYGFWTDNVWVDYEGSIESADEDVVTIYGTVKGSKSYETQIGGETYVPQIKARYIDE